GPLGPPSKGSRPTAVPAQSRARISRASQFFGKPMPAGIMHAQGPHHLGPDNPTKGARRPSIFAGAARQQKVRASRHLNPSKAKAITALALLQLPPTATADGVGV